MLLTISIIDKNSSEIRTKTFSTDNVENFKKNIIEWENSVPFLRYEMTTEEVIEEYSLAVVSILDELEITY